MQTIDIDNETAALLREIDSANPGENWQSTVEEMQRVLIDSVLGPFGLSAEILKDVDGGNITTLHNFKKGVTANQEDLTRHESWRKAQTNTFDRRGYDAELPGERKEVFKNGPVTDGYTGKELPRDGRTHRDHVISASEIERSAKAHLGQTRAERVATANIEENKVWATGGMNASKKDSDLKDWAARPNRRDSSKTNAEVHELDEARAADVYQKAHESVGQAQDSAVFQKQATEFAIEGGAEAGKLAARQIVGLLLADLIKGLSQDVKLLMRDGLQDVEAFASMLKDRAARILEQIKEKWKHYLQEGIAAGISGLLSSIATLLINSFITTAKRFITILREAILAVARAVRLIVLPDPSMTRADIARAVLKILAGAIVVAFGVALHESLKKLFESVPFLAPFSEELAAVITAAATGLAGFLILLGFDAVKSTVAFRNKQLADTHRRQSVVLLQMKKTTWMLHQAELVTVQGTQKLADDIAQRELAMASMRKKADSSLGDFEKSVERLAALARKKST